MIDQYKSPDPIHSIGISTSILSLFLWSILLIPNYTHARDLGQWDNLANSEDIRRWFNSLMQPDAPQVSCCGPADAYYADSFKTDPQTGQYIAIVTDDRDDAALRRPHVPVGTEIVVPNAKLKWDQGNPTGHGVIFLGIPYASTAETYYHVYCYVTPGRG